MNRSEFLKLAVLGCASAAMAPCMYASESGMTRRPNILWLSCEDMSPNLGCYGDKTAHTPNIDKLAARSVRYTNAFTVAPVCAPNRSCIITGVYPTTLGSHLMRSGGNGQQSKRLPKLPKSIRCFPEYLQDAGYYCTNNVKEDYNFERPPTVWHESSNKAHWRNRPDKSQPFFAVFNYTGTHESSVRQTPEWLAETTERLTLDQRQNPDTIVPPPFHPNTPAVREQWAHYYELITTLDYWVADHLRELDEAGLAEDTIVFFWSDHGVGLPRGKRWLYDSGTHVPLIVYAPEKWRAWTGVEPGTVDDRLISSIDLPPTVLELAGIPVPEYMQGQAFLGTSQAPPREYVYGARDRMDDRYDMFRMVRDKRFKYIRNYMPFKPYGQWVDYCEESPVMQELRRLQAENALPEHAKWVDHKTKPIEELYDTQSDPHELDNLAGRPEHDETLKRLRREHVQWMSETRDLGFFPEPELWALEDQFGSRYEIVDGITRSEPDLMTRLRDAAVRAGRAGRDDIAALMADTASPHASIRYWGIVGLGLIDPPSNDVVAALEDALDDASGIVRIAAAYATARQGGSDAAIPLLIRELASDDEWLRFNAALALDELGEIARPAIPALQKAMNDSENNYVIRVSNHALFTLTGVKKKLR